MVEATSLTGLLSPISSMISLNCWRSSARKITSRVAPIISTPCFSKMPCSSRAQAQLSAVWPPSVGSTASMGSLPPLCLMMIFSTASGVMGSM